MKRGICFVLCALLAIMALSAVCAAEETPERDAGGGSRAETPIDYAIDYTKYSVILEEYLGRQIVENAEAVISAFMDGGTAAEITLEDTYIDLEKLQYAMECICPPFYALTDIDYHRMYSDGVLSWSYPLGEDETKKRIEDFNSEINGFMNRIDVRDSQTARAMILYNAVLENSFYDYDLTGEAGVSEEEYREKASAYAAIMKKSGACTSFATALCFVYTQAGIESIPVSGSSPDSFH